VLIATDEPETVDAVDGRLLPPRPGVEGVDGLGEEVTA
jgi:hypothetical protein